MKNYTVAQPFWRQGVLLEVGETLRMTDEEAKFIRHLLDVAPEADEAPAAEPTPESFAEAEGVQDPREAPAARDGADAEDAAVQARIVSAVKARKA